MSPVSVLDGQGVCVWEEAGEQRTVLAGESELWDLVWKVRCVGHDWTGADLSLFYHTRLLACGFHHCERPCHADACGTCTTVCGKSRKSWYVAPGVSIYLNAHNPCSASQPTIPVHKLATPPLPAPKPNPVSPQSHSHVPVDTFVRPCLVQGRNSCWRVRVNVRSRNGTHDWQKRWGSVRRSGRREGG